MAEERYNPYTEKNKRRGRFRWLIPVVIIGLVLSIFGLTASIYLSRSTKYVVDESTLKMVQLKPEPQNGDEICIIHTNLGDISAKLYPEYAPNTVKNFEKLAESGYYDNTYIYNIINDVYFEAGSPNKSGSLDAKKDSRNEKIKMEYNQNLWPLKGAVYSVTTEVDKGFVKTLMNKANRYGGSRFGICGSVEIDDDMKKSLLDSSKEVGQAFVDVGGIPNFSQQVTIFAQAYDGLDTIDKILSQNTEDETNFNGYTQPKKTLKIKNIEIKKYNP